MSDLVCARCDATATYADAHIADLNETCEVVRGYTDRHGKPHTSTLPARHDWEEAR